MPCTVPHTAGTQWQTRRSMGTIFILLFIGDAGAKMYLYREITGFHRSTYDGTLRSLRGYREFP